MLRVQGRCRHKCPRTRCTACTAASEAGIECNEELAACTRVRERTLSQDRYRSRHPSCPPWEQLPPQLGRCKRRRARALSLQPRSALSASFQRSQAPRDVRHSAIGLLLRAVVCPLAAWFTSPCERSSAPSIRAVTHLTGPARTSSSQVCARGCATSASVRLGWSLCFLKSTREL